MLNARNGGECVFNTFRDALSPIGYMFYHVRAPGNLGLSEQDVKKGHFGHSQHEVGSFINPGREMQYPFFSPSDSTDMTSTENVNKS